MNQIKNKEEFNEVIKKDKVVIDFYADWCGPCKMLAKVLEDVNNNILKINVDKHGDLATQYGVMSIPTICFFKNGELVKKHVGFIGKEDIEKILVSL